MSLGFRWEFFTASRWARGHGTARAGGPVRTNGGHVAAVHSSRTPFHTQRNGDSDGLLGRAAVIRSREERDGVLARRQRQADVGKALIGEDVVGFALLHAVHPDLHLAQWIERRRT